MPLPTRANDGNGKIIRSKDRWRQQAELVLSIQIVCRADVRFAGCADVSRRGGVVGIRDGTTHVFPEQSPGRHCVILHRIDKVGQWRALISLRHTVCFGKNSAAGGHHIVPFDHLDGHGLAKGTQISEKRTYGIGLLFRLGQRRQKDGNQQRR